MICNSFVPALERVQYLRLHITSHLHVYAKFLSSRRNFITVCTANLYFFFTKKPLYVFFIDVKNYNVKQTHVFSLIEVKVVVRVK